MDIISLLVVVLISYLKLSSTSVIASGQFDRCVANQTVTFGCYNGELNSIVQQQGPKAAFGLLKIQYPKIAYVRAQCHELTHVIGRAAYLKEANLADTFAQGDSYCQSGYYHGAIEGLSKQKGVQYLINNLNEVCGSVAPASDIGLFRYCLHGLGHGLMESLNHSVLASSVACDRLGSLAKQHVCYEGVFMQLLIDENHPPDDLDAALTIQNATNPMYPCTILDDKYKPICYFVQVPFKLPIDNYDFAKVYGVCSQSFDIFVNNCYKLYSLNDDSKDASLNNNRLTKAICLPGPTFESRDYCIRGVVEVLLLSNRASKATQLCDSLEPKLKTNCRDYLKYYASQT